MTGERAVFWFIIVPSCVGVALWIVAMLAITFASAFGGGPLH